MLLMWMCASDKCFSIVGGLFFLCEMKMKNEKSLFYLSFTETTSKRTRSSEWWLLFWNQKELYKTWSVWTFGFSSVNSYIHFRSRAIQGTENRKWKQSLFWVQSPNTSWNCFRMENFSIHYGYIVLSIGWVIAGVGASF